MGSFSLWHWLILGIFAYGIYRLVKSDKKKGDVAFCTSCGSEGPSSTQTRGSIWIEVILWLCFLIPGVIYSIWRLTTRRQVCSTCGASSLVPPGSPVALATKKRLNADT